MKQEKLLSTTNRIFAVCITVIIISIVMGNHSSAQSLPGKTQKCIVSLTYDDGLDVDLDNVVPSLDSLGFKGTFYVPANSESLNKRMEEWRAVAKNGHELGNHTSFHPCNGKSKKRDWVLQDYDMDIYTMKRMVDEIKLANAFLKSIDGKTQRTFAYTCGDQEIGGENIWDKIKDEFVAARGVNGEMPAFSEIKLNNVGSYMMADKTGEEMIEFVKMAMKNNTLIVYLFHGVGGGHNINVALKEHSKLLHFLKENEKDIWVAPFLEVAEYIKTNQDKK